MKTNMNLTFSALNGYYLTSGEKINAEYLCDAIVMWAMNTQNIYNELVRSSRKINSIVWEAFLDLANDHIKNECRGYSCSGYQLKKWLATYGKGYDTLSQAIEELQEERNTLQND